jgi:hypothetical protein
MFPKSQRAHRSDTLVVQRPFKQTVLSIRQTLLTQFRFTDSVLLTRLELEVLTDEIAGRCGGGMTGLKTADC